MVPPLAALGRARGLRAVYPHHREVYGRWQQRARTAEPVGTAMTRASLAALALALAVATLRSGFAGSHRVRRHGRPA